MHSPTDDDSPRTERAGALVTERGEDPGDAWTEVGVVDGIVVLVAFEPLGLEGFPR